MRCILFFLILVSFPVYAQKAGERDYNAVSKTYQFYTGSVWREFKINVGLIPCAKEAAMNYNTILNTYEYCNGTHWVAMIGLPTLSLCSKRAEMKYESGKYYYCNGVLWVNIITL